MRNVFSAWQNIHFGHRRRVVLVSVLVGVLTAGLTILFFLAVEYASFFFQTVLMGLHHPVPAGEHLLLPEVTRHGQHPLLVLLLPALGAAAGGWLVFRFAPEARGHAIDAAIRAFHRTWGKIRFRVPLVRAFGAILTIGSGGSGGRIGPAAHLGAGAGSWIARLFGLTEAEQRTLAVSGCAAGIGAICRAPLGGALTAVEILYKDDFETSAIVPSVVSSLTSYSLFMWFLACPLAGRHGLTIHHYPSLGLRLPADLLPYLVLALLCAGVGRLFIWLFFSLRTKFFTVLPIPRWVQCGIGGLLVGALGLMAWETLGGGLGYLQEALDIETAGVSRTVLLLFAGYFLLLALLKMLATSFTVGSGGSGGLFGPALVVGGLLGAGFGAACHAGFPGATLPPMSGFVAVGMAAFFSTVANAPIGAVVLVSEMTGSYALLPALLVVSVTAFVLVRRRSLYESQAEHRQNAWREETSELP